MVDLIYERLLRNNSCNLTFDVLCSSVSHMFRLAALPRRVYFTTSGWADRKLAFGSWILNIMSYFKLSPVNKWLYSHKRGRSSNHEHRPIEPESTTTPSQRTRAAYESQALERQGAICAVLDAPCRSQPRKSGPRHRPYFRE